MLAFGRTLVYVVEIEIRADPRSTLTRHILNVLIVSASGGQKPQFWKLTFLGQGSCIDPLLPIMAKFGVLQQTHGLRLPAKFRLDRFILSSSGGEKLHNFCRFLDFGI